MVNVKLNDPIGIKKGSDTQKEPTILIQYEHGQVVMRFYGFKEDKPHCIITEGQYFMITGKGLET